MGKKKLTRKFSVTRMVSAKDIRMKRAQKDSEHKEKRVKALNYNPNELEDKELPQEPSNMFLSVNKSLGPPYRILLDTNFLNFSIMNKLDIFKAAMDCLYGKCIPYISDCVIAELEKLGHKYRMAIRLTKDPRFQRLTCTHKGTYADDCIVNEVTANRLFIVATCDKDLKRRIRKIPGVPIMFIHNHKYAIERLPGAIN